ncbi:hypothetical protein G6F68_012673 [Rhizopus microsporus]|nr:hypothetical protein G6F68_012673 [Rhizopus microsporus]
MHCTRCPASAAAPLARSSARPRTTRSQSSTATSSAYSAATTASTASPACRPSRSSCADGPGRDRLQPRATGLRDLPAARRLHCAPRRPHCRTAHAQARQDAARTRSGGAAAARRPAARTAAKAAGHRHLGTAVDPATGGGRQRAAGLVRCARRRLTGRCRGTAGAAAHLQPLQAASADTVAAGTRAARGGTPAALGRRRRTSRAGPARVGPGWRGRRPWQVCPDPGGL